MTKDPLKGQAFDTPKEAAAAAEILKCSGIHRTTEGWMPCASAEALDALVNGGVEAYRAIQESKSLPKKTRKIRRVAVDPNARDADSDKLVQEGTTAERPAGVKVPDAKKPGKAVTSDISTTPKNTVTADPAATRLERRFKPMLDKVDADLRSLGGIGRARTTVEGPHPVAVARMEEITAQIEADHGKLETLEDYTKALQEVFPNAIIDFTSHHSLTDETPEVTKLDPKNPLAAYGDDTDTLMKSMKGFLNVVLFKGSADPEAAKLVGSIQLMRPDGEAYALAGVSLGNKFETPIAIQVNPGKFVAGEVSSETAADISQHLLDDLKRRDQIKESGEAFSFGKWAYVDSDPELDAAWIGFHEWAHVKGLALARKEEDQEFIDGVQEWVKTGADSPWLVDFPELTSATTTAKKALAKMAKADPKHVEEFSAGLEQMGFVGVDVNNPDQVLAVLRAGAARNVLAHRLMAQLDERTATLEMADWKKFDTISGYGNITREESIAELFAFADMAPDEAMKLFKPAFKIPEVQERL